MAVIGLAVMAGTAVPAWADFQVTPFPPGNIYFVPENKMDDDFASFCGLAGATLELAAYSLKSSVVGDALIAAHQRGVVVRVVTDQDNTGSNTQIPRLIEAGIPVVPDNRESLMHDKFCIIDRRYVWTGSTNLTSDGTQNNYNDSIIFDAGVGDELVLNYEAEFREMFVDELFGTASTATAPYPEVNIGGVTVEVYFAPEDNGSNVMNRLIETVSAATESIDILIFSFTDSSLARTLLEQAKAGVTVRVLMDGTQGASQYSQFNYLRKHGIDTAMESTPYLLHHKMTIVDKKVVTTGSFNFSKSANTSNDENMIIIHSEDLATQYYTEAFKTRYADLNPGVSLKGFVHVTESASGDMLGVAGAQVRLTDSGGTVDLLTTSDEHGWFSFRNLSTGETYTVHAEKSGSLAAEKSNLTVSTGVVTRINLELSEVATWGSLAGKVTDSQGNNVSMAQISITYPSKSLAPQGTVFTQVVGITDTEGNYLIQRIPAYQWQVFGQSYPVDVAVTKSGYESYTLDAFDHIDVDTTYTLNVTLQQSYQITGFSNPILDDWVVITVKGQAGSSKPRVDLVQKNYLSVQVDMTEIGDGQGLFTGPYQILTQYPGEAQIIVNSGEAVGSFMVRVLQPRQGGQVASTDKAMRMLVKASDIDSPLPVTIFKRPDPSGGNMRILSGTYRIGPVAGSRGLPVSLELDYRAELLPSGQPETGRWEDRIAVYARRRETGLLEFRPSAVDTVSKTVKATDIGFSEYMVLLDENAPEITALRDTFNAAGTETAVFRVHDDLSGVDLHGIEVVMDGQETDFSFNRLTRELKLKQPATSSPDGEYVLSVTARDMVGNRSEYVHILQAGGLEMTQVAGYPNPVRLGQDATVRFTLSTVAQVTVRVLDYHGDLIRVVTAAESLGAGFHNHLIWDGSNDSGDTVANGIYFLQVRASTGGKSVEKMLKIAVLK